MANKLIHILLDAVDFSTYFTCDCKRRFLWCFVIEAHSNILKVMEFHGIPLDFRSMRRRHSDTVCTGRTVCVCVYECMELPRIPKIEFSE